MDVRIEIETYGDEREGFGHVVFVVHDDAIEVKNIECFVGSPPSVFLTLIGICTAFAHETSRRVYSWRFTNPRLQRLYERLRRSSGSSLWGAGVEFGAELDPLKRVDADPGDSAPDSSSADGQPTDTQGDAADVEPLSDFERLVVAFVLNGRPV